MFRSVFILLVLLPSYGSDLQTDVTENTRESTSTDSVEIGTTISSRFQAPTGYIMEIARLNTFAHYLQTFPLYAPHRKVYYYDGQPKSNQLHHAAVMNIDVGRKDLQQCADAIMRLRAEYLFEQNELEKINFHFTNGFLARFDKWIQGYRIRVEGNHVVWYKTTRQGADRKAFKSFIETVFIYSGTISLQKELIEKDVQDLTIGDVFIQGGSPGHAVLVVDMARHPNTGDKAFLLAQSYMPAQDIHILRNKKIGRISPWYSLAEIEDYLYTPEWTFRRADLGSFLE